MGKSLFVKLLLGIGGGVNAVYSMITPLLLSLLWIKNMDLEIWQICLIFGITFVAMIFRAYKIGFITEHG